jgi:hypothetical protein
MSETTAPTQNPSDVSDEEKKKAVLAEYCKIINNNQSAITEMFQKSINAYFERFKGSKENEKKIQDFMFNKIFEIVDKSITADNPAIKSFISAIIEKGTINNNILYEPFKQSQESSQQIITPETTLTRIVEKLEEPVDEYGKTPRGGNFENKGGKEGEEKEGEGKEEEKEGEGKEGDKKKVEDIVNFFTLNVDSVVINREILDIILLAFERELKTPKNKLFIYETITQKIEKNIGNAIEGFGDKWFDDEQLVKTVLHNILTNRNFIDNNNNIKGLFKGAIEKFIDEVRNKNPQFIVNGNINYEKLNELLLEAFRLQPLKPEDVKLDLSGGRKNKTRKPKITRKKRTKRRHTKKA